MREHLTRRPAFHRTTLSDRIGEKVTGIGSERIAGAPVLIPPGRIVRVVGEALGARLILGGALGTHGLLTPLDVSYESVFPALERHGLHVVRRELAWRES